MTQWFPLFLLLHVLAAIVAFGPIFAFPLIGRMGGAEPQHANFSTRVSAAISSRITIPAALTMPVSGVLMIWSTGMDPAQLWLAAGIALYVFAVVYAIVVQGRNVQQLIRLSSPPVAPAGQSLAPGPGMAAGGPPPELAATIRRVQTGGMLLIAVIVVIVSLMVARPTL